MVKSSCCPRRILPSPGNASASLRKPVAAFLVLAAYVSHPIKQRAPLPVDQVQELDQPLVGSDQFIAERWVVGRAQLTAAASVPYAVYPRHEMRPELVTSGKSHRSRRTSRTDADIQRRWSALASSSSSSSLSLSCHQPIPSPPGSVLALAGSECPLERACGLGRSRILSAVRVRTDFFCTTSQADGLPSTAGASRNCSAVRSAKIEAST